MGYNYIIYLQYDMKTQEDVANPTTTSLAAFCFAGWSHIHDMWPPKAQGHPQFRSNIQLLAQVHSSHSWTCTHWSPWIRKFPSQNAGMLHSKIMDLPFFWGFSLPKCWVCPLKNPLCRVSGRVLMSSQVWGASWQKISYQWWYRTILRGDSPWCYWKWIPSGKLT